MKLYLRTQSRVRGLKQDASDIDLQKCGFRTQSRVRGLKHHIPDNDKIGFFAPNHGCVD